MIKDYTKLKPYSREQINTFLDKIGPEETKEFVQKIAHFLNQRIMENKDMDLESMYYKEGVHDALLSVRLNFFTDIPLNLT